MTSILQRVWSAHQYIMEKYEYYSDPRTKDFFLASSPFPLLFILSAWLYFCLSLGPQLMKHRKPFELKNTLIVYNIIQIIMSVAIFYLGGTYGWWTTYSYTCEPVDYSNSPQALAIARLVWLYYIAKITELLDTVFFVLRKKNNQITNLHIYHHTIMPIFSWIGVRFMAGGHGTFLGWLNSFIHIIMYTYYLLAGLGPQFQKYLWWKKHLTALQVIQFVIIFWHNFSVLFRDCSYPKLWNVLGTLEASLFIYLFGKFYIASYIKDRSVKENGESKHKNHKNGKAD